MQNEILESLKKIALTRSQAFCYSCYRLASTGRCECCGSDDLMRHVTGVGVEYGTEWIIDHIISTELTPVDTEEAFEQYVEACYPEMIQVGWLNVCTVTILKEHDPISWDIAKSEYLDNEVSDDVFITFDNGSNYYRISDIEEFLGGEE